jgi:hypothetical protein
MAKFSTGLSRRASLSSIKTQQDLPLRHSPKPNGKRSSGRAPSKPGRSSSFPEVGRTLRPDLLANQRGAAAAPSRANRPAISTAPSGPQQPTRAAWVTTTDALPAHQPVRPHKGPLYSLRERGRLGTWRFRGAGYPLRSPKSAVCADRGRASSSHGGGEATRSVRTAQLDSSALRTGSGPTIAISFDPSETSCGSSGGPSVSTAAPRKLFGPRAPPHRGIDPASHRP